MLVGLNEFDLTWVNIDDLFRAVCSQPEVSGDMKFSIFLGRCWWTFRVQMYIKCYISVPYMYLPLLTSSSSLHWKVFFLQRKVLPAESCAPSPLTNEIPQDASVEVMFGMCIFYVYMPMYHWHLNEALWAVTLIILQAWNNVHVYSLCQYVILAYSNLWILVLS